MYLKALEIQGFKSFPDKTVLTFGNDITAIVGPNGSGKSNISDAIRWVMGEQSTKALRGAKMEDVIFGGTQKRAQVGFAEASLIFDNSDGSFKMESKEIMVTRRYYRSGESEYYINKQSARLRDINELFMDTGLGREGYSNISQGRIDEILSLKSTDRREIFEEAAGISKFRHRKEETERRLATTEDNLLRIGDKISELEYQVEPLREQAEKAKQFLEYRGELRGLEIAVWLDTLDKLSETARKAEENFNSAVFILQQEHDSLDKLYVTAESLSFELHSQDLQTEQIRDEISAMEADAQRYDGQIAVLQSNIENNEQNVERIRQELLDSDSRSGNITEQIEKSTQRIAEINRQTEELDKELTDAQAEAKRLADSAEGMTKQFIQLQAKQSQAAADLAARNADLSAVLNAIELTQQRIDTVRNDTSAASSRKDETKQQLDTVRKALREANDEVVSCKNAISGFTLRAQSRQEKKQTLEKRVSELSTELDTTTAKVSMFREMEHDFEGFSKAVKFVMQESERGALRNIHGPVSTLIRTDDDYTVAIEIALGSAMQQIVVSSEQDGKYAMSLLKNKDIGRATFLPLSTIKPSPFRDQSVKTERGFVGIASDLVECDEKYQQIITYLLGHTVIAETVDLAIAMAKKFDHRFRIVTLDGQVMNAGGSMTGGSVSKNTGILSRANELARLEKKAESLTQKVSDAQQQLTEATRSLDEVEFEMAAVSEQLREKEDEVLRLEGEEKQYSVLFDAISDALATSESEIASLNERMNADNAHRAELSGQITVLEKQCADIENESKLISLDQSAAEESAGEIAERLTSLRMDIAALQAERQTQDAAIENLNALADAMKGDRSQKEALIAHYQQENEQISRQIANAQAEQAQHNEKTLARREELKGALAQRQSTEEKKTRLEKEAQQKSKDILEMERESARLENKKNTAELEEKQIIDKLWDSYELTRSTAVPERAEIESITQANREIASLKRKISALGSPNLGAIEEFARVNERYQYLSGQRDDVLTSKRELEAIIKDITTQMTEIFVTEFAKIDTYFGQTFTEMFGGGKGALVLEDPENPLTCGIEIHVQPPGKQLKTITLLSGGEKAFVAIALYFAILKVRPTPFCMLDEIDAALDDRNVERFANYLRNLCQKTQFIVITHRRGTMEEADILYGVTMQEQGVSKILHLDLNQMDQQLGIIE